MWILKRETFESIVIAAKERHPSEFMAMIASKNKNRVIDELVVVPIMGDSESVSIRVDLIPFDESIVGTVHSHPSFSNQPSRADLHTFSETGNIHFIINKPFKIENLAAYDNSGNRVEWTIR